MPVNSLHELKREARVIDDDTSDVSSCADLVRLLISSPTKPNSNCRFAIIILRYFASRWYLTVNTKYLLRLLVLFTPRFTRSIN